jgi:transposase-like protein
MVHILPDITSLTQYLSILADNPETIRLDKCPNCGKSYPKKYGFYFRQSDRINPSTASLNAIPIQRYYCRRCNTTCSVLPECIPPRRWYLWELQKLIFLFVFMGSSICATAKKVLPSRQTISRWMGRLQAQFVFHKDVLCSLFSDLGRVATDVKDFWLTAFKKISLGAAMRLCHVCGVNIP